MRWLALAALLTLPGCAAIPPAAWAAIGAIAGAVSQTEQFNTLLLQAWEATHPPKEMVCPIPK